MTDNIPNKPVKRRGRTKRAVSSFDTSISQNESSLNSINGNGNEIENESENKNSGEPSEVLIDTPQSTNSKASSNSKVTKQRSFLFQ